MKKAFLDLWLDSECSYEIINSLHNLVTSTQNALKNRYYFLPFHSSKEEIQHQGQSIRKSNQMFFGIVMNTLSHNFESVHRWNHSTYITIIKNCSNKHRETQKTKGKNWRKVLSVNISKITILFSSLDAKIEKRPLKWPCRICKTCAGSSSTCYICCKKKIQIHLHHTNVIHPVVST